MQQYRRVFRCQRRCGCAQFQLAYRHESGFHKGRRIFSVFFRCTDTGTDRCFDSIKRHCRRAVPGSCRIIRSLDYCCGRSDDGFIGHARLGCPCVLHGHTNLSGDRFRSDHSQKLPLEQLADSSLVGIVIGTVTIVQTYETSGAFHGHSHIIGSIFHGMSVLIFCRDLQEDHIFAVGTQSGFVCF